MTRSVLLIRRCLIRPRMPEPSPPEPRAAPPPRKRVDGSFRVPVTVHPATSDLVERSTALSRALERLQRTLLATEKADDPRPAARAGAPGVDGHDAPMWVESESPEVAWIEYFEGTSPLVLASPHDGRLAPRWAARRASETVTVRDKGASAVACAVALRLVAGAREAREALMPHLLLCHVSRGVVDVNREPATGCACARGAAVHGAYHQLLQRALSAAGRAFPGRELFVDFHAQSHFRANGGHDSIELGYLLPLSALAQGAALLDAPTADGAAARARCTLHRLWAQLDERARAEGEGGARLSELLAGKKSLGELLRARSVLAVPRAGVPAALGGDDGAPSGGGQPAPAAGAAAAETCEGGAQACQGAQVQLTRYFFGRSSHTLARAVGSGADAVQLEMPIRISANPFRWPDFCDAIAGALREWAAEHYGADPCGGAAGAAVVHGGAHWPAEGAWRGADARGVVRRGSMPAALSAPPQRPEPGGGARTGCRRGAPASPRATLRAPLPTWHPQLSPRRGSLPPSARGGADSGLLPTVPPRADALAARGGGPPAAAALARVGAAADLGAAAVLAAASGCGKAGCAVAHAPGLPEPPTLPPATRLPGAGTAQRYPSGRGRRVGGPASEIGGAAPAGAGPRVGISVLEPR